MPSYVQAAQAVVSIYASNKASSATKGAAKSTLNAAQSAEALNRERWAQAQGYLDPYAGRANIAAQQLQAEMGLPQYTPQTEPEPESGEPITEESTQGSQIGGRYAALGRLNNERNRVDPVSTEPINPYADTGQEFTPRDISQIPGYQDVMDESLGAAEQSAISSGSTTYGGRRIEAAGQVGASVQQSYYNNYMNMLQNLASPTAATNLSSMGMNQGVAIGQQNIAATGMANDYRLQGVEAQNAAIADMMGAASEGYSAYMNRPKSGATEQPADPWI